MSRRKSSKIGRALRGPGRGPREGRHWSETALVLVVGFKIAGLVLIFDTSSAHPFDGPKANFSLAIACILLGLISIVAMRQRLGAVRRTWMHLPVAALAVTTLFATIFAEDRYIAMFGADRRLGLTFVFDMVVLYLAIAVAFRTARDWAALAGVVAAVGVATMIYGFVQYVGLDPISWVDDVRARPPSTFGNSNKFGHFLGATLVTAAALALVPLDLPRRIRLLAALYAFAALTTAAVIATRGTLLGVGAGLVGLGLVYFRRSRPTLERRTIIGAAGATVSLAVVAAVLLVATPLGERVRGGLADTGVQQRLFLAEASLGAFRDRPLTGHGPDHFGIIYPQYRPAASNIGSGNLVNQNSAHNWVLQAAVTTGLPGLTALASVAFGSLILLWRAVGGSPQLAVPLLVGGVAYWTQGLVTVGSVSVDWMGWVAAGAAAALGRPVLVTPPRRVPSLPQAIAIGLALVLAVSGLQAFQANRELKTARASRVDRISPAERAVRLDPGRAEHWYALGLARQDRQMWAASAEAFRVAADRAPYLSEYWSSLAISLTNLVATGDQSKGGREAALAAARRGAQVNRSYSTPRHVLAVVANNLGEYSEALDASIAAIRLFKGDPQYEAVAAEAALRLQDPRDARSGLERIVAEKDAAVLRIALARVSLKLSDPDAARAHLRRALELEPQNVPALELTRQIGT